MTWVQIWFTAISKFIVSILTLVHQAKSFTFFICSQGEEASAWPIDFDKCKV